MLDFRIRGSQRVLRVPAFRDIPEYKDNAQHLARSIAYGSAAVVNRYLAAVLCHQDSVVGQPYNLTVFQYFHHGILDHRTRVFVHNVEDQRK